MWVKQEMKGKKGKQKHGEKDKQKKDGKSEKEAQVKRGRKEVKEGKVGLRRRQDKKSVDEVCQYHRSRVFYYPNTKQGYPSDSLPVCHASTSASTPASLGVPTDQDQATPSRVKLSDKSSMPRVCLAT